MCDIPPPPEPQKNIGRELQIDDDSAGLGVAALVGAAVLVPVLAFGVATTLGMGVGSADNDGIGSPLTSQEVRALNQAQQRSREDGPREGEPLTYEEAAEEQALVDILQGGIRRAR